MAEEAKGTSTPKRKGTQRTESIIGSSAKRLESALSHITAATTEAAKLTKHLEDASMQIADKEQRILELDTQYQEKKRQLQVQLDLDAREDIEGVVNEYLTSNDRIAVEREGYELMKEEFSALKTQMAEKVKAEVGKAVGIEKSNMAYELKLKEAEFNQKEADNKAKIISLQEQLNAAKADSENWRKQLEAERIAQTERSKNNAVGSINLSQPSR